MFASAPQYSAGNTNNNVQFPHKLFSRSISTLEKEDFYKYIQQQYGACWGTLRFEDSLSDYSKEAPPFLYIDDGIDLYALSRFMMDEWGLNISPKMVIPILSSVTKSKPFKNPKMISTLKTGVRNAANASEIWFTTNGLDTGVPQIIGSAFRDENLIRRADDAWAKQMDREPKKRKALVLIGIVCDAEINSFIIFNPGKDKHKMDVKVPARNRNQLSLNRDHTHFIIIREPNVTPYTINISGRQLSTNESSVRKPEKLTDLAESTTNRFRDRFESFLRQDNSEQQQQSSPSVVFLSPPPTTTNSITVSAKKGNLWDENGIPMVGTFVGGTPGTIELLYKKIEQGVPVVVFKGIGLAADIIAFANEEISAKNDKEYEDGYLKFEIARRLLDEFPVLKENNVKRNEIRNFIISIVKKADQGKRKLLSFIDINSATPPLNEFHKIILSALLKSRTTDATSKDNVQLKRNLILTLEWKLPDLALSEIFQRNDDTKYPIQDELFDKALLGKKREAFVDLFLEQEFDLRRYLKSDKLVYLFNEAYDKDFLTTTSLERILGLSGDDGKVPKDFIENGLNKILKRLTGISHFFSKYEMDCNAMGIYFGDKTDKGVQRQKIRAEKRALRHLIVYAVLLNQHTLAKTLWKRSSEPIPLALICCMMLKSLAPYCYESYQKTLLGKQAQEFSGYAVGVLGKAFDKDDIKTYEMLDEKHADWNNMTTVELAYNADNKEFLAHDACQKWLTKQYYGEITPRELSWGFFKCPGYLKIILSAILIFPMTFWISFSPIGQAPPSIKKPIALPDAKKNPKRHGRKASVEQIDETKSDEEPKSFLKQIELLWSAPITKFYTNFAAYIVFLSFFTLAVLWPSCGNLFLDCLVWFWTASIAFENTRVAYEKYCSQSNLSVKQAILEVIVQTIFLALYLIVRIIGLWNFGTCQILTAKAVLGVGLIYYYYRILFIFLPISPTLGPMMIRLRYMIMDDFFTFLQLFLIFMISSGVAITAVLYPHYPLGLELFSKALVFRGLMALFSSEMRDLKSQHHKCSINATSEIDKEYSCQILSHGLTFSYDNLHAYKQYGITSPKCNQPSWIAWFLLIQYFFLAKRFLISLLTAMFSLTGVRVQSQSQQIWLYNRYEIVMENKKRPRLPPPFVVISYIGMLISGVTRHCILALKKYSDRKNDSRRRTGQHFSAAVTDGYHSDENPNLTSNPMSPLVSSTIRDNNINQSDVPSTEIIENRSLLERILDCKSFRAVTEKDKNNKEVAKRNWADSEAYSYWKYKAEEFYSKTLEADQVQEKLNTLIDNGANTQKDIDALRKSLRQINDRVVRSEKLIIDSHILLEKIRVTVLQKDKVLPDTQNFIHMLARESPYSFTNEARFPVAERYISWKIKFDLYDPIVITLPKEHSCFRDNERLFVEPDLIKPTSDIDDGSQVTDYLPATPVNQPNTFEATEPPTTMMTNGFTFPLSDYKWNQIVELRLPNGKTIVVDRTTWITNPRNKKPVKYQLDIQLLIPLNPMGRTGVRGRGGLIRWGPNKSVMAIITRWRKRHDHFATIDGQRILEILVFKDKYSNQWKLPGGKMLGVESAYSTVCRSFNELAFQDNDSEQSLSLDEDHMIEYFQSYARSSSATGGFESHMVYRGYIDDERNTDNAWVEAEIWNFHYGATTLFPHARTDGMALWKDMPSNTRESLIQTSILREIARLHNAYFE